ncbi:MAG: hypothetical protein WBQ83_01075, partial [Candidatus Acidiferrales bacterium]
MTLAIGGLASISACGGGGSGNVQVTAVAITPTSTSVPINTTTTFTADVTLSNSTNNTTTTTITWYVNGTAGGSAALGTIGVSSVDALQGVYTAPSVVPTSGVTNGEVTITATTPQIPGSTTNSNIITSNMAELTVTAGTGLSVSPTTAQVPAGGTQQFNA